MTDPANFSEARERLEDIVKQVRSKDVSLEKSLDLFDEAIKMGNSCFEKIDRIDAGDSENALGEEERVEAPSSPESAEGTGAPADDGESEEETTPEQQDDQDSEEISENE